MKKDDIQKFEKNVLNIIQKVSLEYFSIFQEVGLTFKVNNVRTLKAQEAIYESEISIDFYGQTGICDVVEFHIFKNGNPVTSCDEIENWLKESYKNVLQREKGTGEGDREGDRPQKGTGQ